MLTTDDGRKDDGYLYILKAHLSAFGSGELTTSYIEIHNRTIALEGSVIKLLSLLVSSQLSYMSLNNHSYPVHGCYAYRHFHCLTEDIKFYSISFVHMHFTQYIQFRKQKRQQLFIFHMVCKNQ